MQILLSMKCVGFDDRELQIRAGINKGAINARANFNFLWIIMREQRENEHHNMIVLLEKSTNVNEVSSIYFIVEPIHLATPVYGVVTSKFKKNKLD